MAASEPITVDQVAHVVYKLPGGTGWKTTSVCEPWGYGVLLPLWSSSSIEYLFLAIVKKEDTVCLAARPEKDQPPTIPKRLNQNAKQP